MARLVRGNAPSDANTDVPSLKGAGVCLHSGLIVSCPGGRLSLRRQPGDRGGPIKSTTAVLDQEAGGSYSVALKSGSMRP